MLLAARVAGAGLWRGTAVGGAIAREKLFRFYLSGGSSGQVGAGSTGSTVRGADIGGKVAAPRRYERAFRGGKEGSLGGVTWAARGGGA